MPKFDVEKWNADVHEFLQEVPPPAGARTSEPGSIRTSFQIFWETGVGSLSLTVGYDKPEVRANHSGGEKNVLQAVAFASMLRNGLDWGAQLQVFIDRLPVFKKT